MTALPWLIETASPGDGLSIVQVALILSVIFIGLFVASYADTEISYVDRCADASLELRS